MRNQSQLKFQDSRFKSRVFFGGSLTTTRVHRTQRPLSTKYPIHLVLRSTKAKGELSFWKKQNADLIKRLLKKYSVKWGVKVLSCANVGNHIHLMIHLQYRYSYEKFIRGFTGELSLRLQKWNKNKGQAESFWNYRPYSRVIIGQKARLTMEDYIEVNQLEGLGVKRLQVKLILANREKGPPH